MKRIILLFFVIFVMFPLIVKAGIICSDGWESSCGVSGPGCCSHHGGISGGNNYNYSTSDDSFIDRLNDGEYAGILTLIIIFGPIVLGIYFDIKETKESKEKLEQILQERKELKNSYLKYFEEMWDKYQKDKEISVINLNLDIYNDKKEKIKYIIKEQENLTDLLKETVYKYRLRIASIKKITDENLDSVGKLAKKAAISYYKEILECIFKLCVINDVLTKLDKSNEYLTYNEYRDSLFEEYSVFKELLSIYRE